MNTAVNGFVMALFLVYVAAVYGVLLYLMLKLAYGHFPRPSGPRSPARQGHIKRPFLRLAEQRFIHPANHCLLVVD